MKCKIKDILLFFSPFYILVVSEKLKKTSSIFRNYYAILITEIKLSVKSNTSKTFNNNIAKGYTSNNKATSTSLIINLNCALCPIILTNNIHKLLYNAYIFYLTTYQHLTTLVYL